MIEKVYYWFHRKTAKKGEEGEYSSGYWQGRVRKNALEMSRDTTGRLLEVGCGEGLFLQQVMHINPDLDISGVDKWNGILSKARTRLQGAKTDFTLLKADATDLPFDDSFFDTVVCINVFFNMESSEKLKGALKEIARVCKKRGRIIFDFRNSRNPLLFIKYQLAKYYDSTVKELPLNTYSSGSIKMIVKDLDLDIIQERHLFFPIKSLAPIIMLETVKT
jgi:ubiquinone/menaquinone biosynthesis C-methylase UbiE